VRLILTVTIKFLFFMSDTKCYVFGQDGNNQNGFGSDFLTGALLGGNGGFGGFGGNGSWLLAFLLFALWGNNGWGGFGNWGGNRGNGCGNAAGFGFLSDLLNNDAGRELLMQAIQGNTNAISQLASTLNCNVGELRNAIASVNTQLCNLGNQVGMSSMQVINAINAGNTTLASQLADCCCKTQTAIAESNYLTERGFCNTNQILAKGFSDLGYATRDQTCSIEKAIAGSTAEILAGQRAAELRDLQNKLETEREKVSQQATAINNYQQTQTFAAMLQPISASLAGLHSEVDGIKCRLPKTEVITAQPDYVPINRGINVNYAPYSCLGGFGFPYGFNNGNGSFF
jgi:hypothetical protein